MYYYEPLYIEHIYGVENVETEDIVVFLNNNILKFKDYFTTLRFKYKESGEYTIEPIKWRQNIIYDSIDNIKNYNGLSKRGYTNMIDDDVKRIIHNSYICIKTDDKKIFSKYKLCK